MDLEFAALIAIFPLHGIITKLAVENWGVCVPLIHVTAVQRMENMRLIDADKMKEVWAHGDMVYESCGIGKALCMAVDAMPTIDAMPVVHGKWMWKQGIAEDDYMLICSECKRPSNSYYDDEYGGEKYISSNYCPNCGAKMDLEAQHD